MSTQQREGVDVRSLLMRAVVTAEHAHTVATTDVPVHDEAKVRDAFMRIAVGLEDAFAAYNAFAELIAAVKNKRNADCGLPKDCGHTFDCTCPGMRLDAAVAACERAS